MSGRGGGGAPPSSNKSGAAKRTTLMMDKKQKEGEMETLGNRPMISIPPNRGEGAKASSAVVTSTASGGTPSVAPGSVSVGQNKGEMESAASFLAGLSGGSKWLKEVDNDGDPKDGAGERLMSVETPLSEFSSMSPQVTPSGAGTVVADGDEVFFSPANKKGGLTAMDIDRKMGGQVHRGSPRRSRRLARSVSLERMGKRKRVSYAGDPEELVEEGASWNAEELREVASNIKAIVEEVSVLVTLVKTNQNTKTEIKSAVAALARRVRKLGETSSWVTGVFTRVHSAALTRIVATQTSPVSAHASGQVRVGAVVSGGVAEMPGGGSVGMAKPKRKKKKGGSQGLVAATDKEVAPVVMGTPAAKEQSWANMVGRKKVQVADGSGTAGAMTIESEAKPGTKTTTRELDAVSQPQQRRLMKELVVPQLL